MNQNTDKKTTTDITFKKEACKEPRRLRTQSGERRADSWQVVEDCLWDMFVDEDEFVTLALADVRYHIRFVQACQIQDGINVQLGVEEGSGVRLVEKACCEAECVDIFRKFYDSSYVEDLEGYTPVKFFV